MRNIKKIYTLEDLLVQNVDFSEGNSPSYTFPFMLFIPTVKGRIPEGRGVLTRWFIEKVCDCNRLMCLDK